MTTTARPRSVSASLRASRVIARQTAGVDLREAEWTRYCHRTER
jgi:hypothetical protein